MNTEILRYLGAIMGGLIFLHMGGESLIKGASRFAASFGIKPILIALTIVSFGTSMPEFVVSLLASLQSNPEIAVANVVGSNIFNLAFILGLSALIKPLKVEVGSIKREIPFMVGSVVVLFLLAMDGILSRADGGILLFIMIVFLLVCFKSKNSEEPDNSKQDTQLSKRIGDNLLILMGLVLLFFGAKWLIYGSVGIAKIFGVSDLIIGLTIIAVGTSLPELVTSTLASFRGQDDIAIGNVTGSNIFNVFFILGLCAVFFPLNVSSTIFRRDLPVLFFISLVSVPLMKSGFRLNRFEGLILLLCYFGYMTLLLKPF